MSASFNGLSKTQIDKINELIKPNNEKYEFLESQEDLLIVEHDKFVKLEKALGHDTKKNKILTNELKTYNDSISCPKIEDYLCAKIKELITHASTSSLEHISICTRCKDVDVDALIDNIALIKSLNEHVAKLDAKC
jgi:hypothetical protein